MMSLLRSRRHSLCVAAACLTVLSSLTGLAAPTAAGEPPSTGGLHGTITGTDGTPLAATTVTVRDLTSRVIDTVSTGVDGTFDVAALLPGRYTVCAETTATGPAAPYGYVHICYPDETVFEAASASPVQVMAGTSPDVSMALSPAGALTGRITDKAGHPLRNVHLRLRYYARAIFNTNYDIWPVDPDVTYGPDGTFLAAGVPPATYDYVCADGARASNQFSPTGYGTACSTRSYRSLGTIVRGGEVTPVSLTLPALGGIRGTVTAAGTGAALAGVAVAVYDQSHNVVGRGRTNADGDYQVHRLMPWSRLLVCFSAFGITTADSPTGYAPQCYRDHPWRGAGDPYGHATATYVAQREWTEHIDQSLPAGGSISGRATTSDGAPVVGVNVQAYTVGYGPRTGPRWVGHVRTDGHGDYRITGLAPRSKPGYVLCFHPPHVVAHHSAGVVGACTSDLSQPRVSRTIPVTAGAQTAGVNRVLGDAAGISGTVTAADGSPLQNVRVQAYPRDSYATTSVRTTMSGHFRVTGLDPARTPFRVCFLPASALGGASATGYVETCLDWTSGSPGTVTDGFDVQLAVGAALTGTVRSAINGAGLEGIGVRVYPGYTQAVTDAEGHFTVAGLSGAETRACFVTPASENESPSSFFFGECYDDKPPPSDTYEGAGDPIPITAGQTTPLDVGLVAGGTIAGHVTRQADGRPVRDVFVEVYDRSGNYVTSTRTDYDGSYETPPVPPASGRNGYKVCFSGTGEVEQCYGDGGEFPSATYSPVPVRALGTRRGIDASLMPPQTITGVVVDRYGRQADGGEIHMFTADNRFVDYVYFGSDGTFALTGLPAGADVKLCAVAWTRAGIPTCYQGRPWPNTEGPPARGTTVVTVGANEQTPVKIVLHAWPTASMSGRLTDPDTGTAIAGAQVFAVRTDGLARDTFTQSDGTYRLRGLARGRYGLCAASSQHTDDAPSGYQTWCLPGARPISRPRSGGIYPEPPSFPIVVRDGPRRDVDLSPAHGGAISGTISPGTAPEPDPPYDPNHSVDIFHDGRYVTSATVLEDGTWRRDGLAPGRYQVCFLQDDPGAGRYVGYQCWRGVPWTGSDQPPQDARPVSVQVDEVTTGIDVVPD